MGDALRSYDHYRWAERYARNNNNDKALAHMRRALHYGMSGFGAVGDDGSIKELESAGLRCFRLRGLNGLSGLDCSGIRAQWSQWTQWAQWAQWARADGSARAQAHGPS